MNVEPYEFVQLAIMAAGGSISGKTKLQKTIYFLGVLTDDLAELGYRPHYYGPYSGVVAQAVDHLRTIGVLEQETVEVGAVDCQGFEVRRYDYRLNKAGRDLAEAKARKNPELWQRLQCATKTLGAGGDLDYVGLSIAAKTYFMLGQRRVPATDEQLATMAAGFGWSVTQEQVRNAAEYLGRIDLVEIAES